MREDERRALYVREVGREPHNLPPGHPDLWQWLYRGTKAERELLPFRLGLEVFEPAEQEESLFE